ncbi:hypothetical protein BDF22DRAFT_668020 [Syncephalis plumigaleata]|nr:hypothetical protein BDF22DRAFT_668020 [Syncephalis plumigaleata]
MQQHHALGSGTIRSWTILTSLLWLVAGLPKGIDVVAGAGARGAIHLPTFIEDIKARPRYNMHFEESIISDSQLSKLYPSLPTVDVESSKHQLLPGEQFMMSIGTRQRYVCHAAQTSTENDDTSKDAKDTTDDQASKSEAELEVERVHNATQLLEPMKDSCIYHNQGWWTYEFCYGKSARQIHNPIDDADEAMTHVLGYYDKRIALSSNDAIHVASSGSSSSSDQVGQSGWCHCVGCSGERRYLTQYWTGGTLCDLTGEPRSIEVQYYCNPQEGEKISYADEPGTCRYVMIVHTPRLCQAPSFAVAQRGEAEQVNCQLVVSDAMYLRAKKRAIARINDQENEQKESTEQQQQEAEQSSNEAIKKKKKTIKKPLNVKMMEQHGKEADANNPLNNGKETKTKNTNDKAAKSRICKIIPMLIHSMPSRQEASTTTKRPGTVQRDGNTNSNKKNKNKQKEGDDDDDESEESNQQHGGLFNILKPIMATVDENGRIQMRPFGGSPDGDDEAMKAMKTYEQLLASLGNMESLNDLFPKELLTGQSTKTNDQSQEDNQQERSSNDDSKKSKKKRSSQSIHEEL